MDKSHVTIKGRGAADNPQGRFDKRARSRDDGEAETQSKPDTVITLQQARSIIARNDSPDLPFTQSINPYQGCEHGCIYCYARPSHAYLGLSPGLDFETRIFAKENAAELLRKELSRPDYRCDLIALGANTDPYQPVERKHRITRGILEVLWEFRNPVGIVTKGSLIERDLDVLEPMAREGLVQVFVSIGSLDGEIARTLEPRAAASVGSEGSFQGLARAALSAQGQARHGAHSRHARRARQRSELRQPHEGGRAVCRAAAQPFRPRLQAAGPQCGKARPAGRHKIPAAGSAARSFVLGPWTRSLVRAFRWSRTGDEDTQHHIVKGGYPCALSIISRRLR